MSIVAATLVIFTLNLPFPHPKVHEQRASNYIYICNLILQHRPRIAPLPIPPPTPYAPLSDTDLLLLELQSLNSKLSDSQYQAECAYRARRHLIHIPFPNLNRPAPDPRYYIRHYLFSRYYPHHPND